MLELTLQTLHGENELESGEVMVYCEGDGFVYPGGENRHQSWRDGPYVRTVSRR